MSEVNFTKTEILTLRRALNSLVTRQQLNLLSASESMKAEIEATLENLNQIDIKLLQLTPCSSQKR
jgi:cobalamin biosynthesis protein CobD/CbiB